MATSGKKRQLTVIVVTVGARRVAKLLVERQERLLLAQDFMQLRWGLGPGSIDPGPIRANKSLGTAELCTSHS